MDIQGTGSRLRRTFRYPTEPTASDSEPEAMDEQEQEDLIARLVAENTSRNAFFSQILLALPLLSTIAYIPSLLRTSGRFPALLGITSLVSTAFLLHRFPPMMTGFEALDKKAKGRPDGRSPLEIWLPWLNLGLAGLSALLGLFRGWSGLGWLPGLVYGVVLVSKMVMAGVDPETELSSLKYGYKGA